MKDYLIYNKELSKFELKTLLKREDILEECYDDWLSCDGNLREALEFSEDETIANIRDNEEKKERNKKEETKKRRTKRKGGKTQKNKQRKKRKMKKKKYRKKQKRGAKHV